MFILQLMHVFSLSFCTIATALGVSRSHGKTATASIDAINRQPAMRTAIFRSTLVALALIETGAILGLLMSFYLLMTPPQTLAGAFAELGIACAVGIPGLIIGWFTAAPAAQALDATARQPFLSRRLFNYMLLVLSLLQTPLIFGFIMGLIIHSLIPTITTTSQGLTLLGAGVSVGIGSVGPVIGSCLFARAAMKSSGKNSGAFQQLSLFTIFSQAIIETPVIFSSVIGFMLTYKARTVYENPVIGLLYLAFGTTMGIGTLGSGISSGRAAAAAAKQISYNPAAYPMISRASLMAQGIIDTIAIYAFVIALWLTLTPLV